MNFDILNKFMQIIPEENKLMRFNLHCIAIIFLKKRRVKQEDKKSKIPSNISKVFLEPSTQALMTEREQYRKH